MWVCIVVCCYCELGYCCWGLVCVCSFCVEGLVLCCVVFDFVSEWYCCFEVSYIGCVGVCVGIGGMGRLCYFFVLSSFCSVGIVFVICIVGVVCWGDLGCVCVVGWIGFYCFVCGCVVDDDEFVCCVFWGNDDVGDGCGVVGDLFVLCLWWYYCCLCVVWCFLLWIFVCCVVVGFVVVFGYYVVSEVL